MSVKFSIIKRDVSRLPEVDFDHIPFGKEFTDHILYCDYENNAWGDVHIAPFHDFSMHPAAMALHYGQTIFEGMKAYKNTAGDAFLFRPEANWERFNISAARMCMPEIDHERFVEGLKKLVELDKAWIPTKEGSAMYLRPYMFATEGAFGVKAAEKYRFAIFCAPVNMYYAEPLKVKIEDHYIRASFGGTGEAKNGGNYGASLLPAAEARKQGFHQLLWTDGKDHKWIEESGTMNVFFVIDNEVYTPALNGNILHGITRDSSLRLLRDNNFKVNEVPVSVDFLVQALKENRVSEAFGAGTAATIAHIIMIGHHEDRYDLPPVEGRVVSNFLKNTLEGIKTGTLPDTYQWMTKV
jgi:branched-chain amino acid aminotransferase